MENFKKVNIILLNTKNAIIASFYVNLLTKKFIFFQLFF